MALSAMCSSKRCPCKLNSQRTEPKRKGMRADVLHEFATPVSDSVCWLLTLHLNPETQRYAPTCYNMLTLEFHMLVSICIWGHPGRFCRFLLQSQGQYLALTFLCVPYLLDSGDAELLTPPPTRTRPNVQVQRLISCEKYALGFRVGLIQPINQNDD